MGTRHTSPVQAQILPNPEGSRFKGPGEDWASERRRRPRKTDFVHRAPFARCRRVDAELRSCAGGPGSRQEQYRAPQHRVDGAGRKTVEAQRWLDGAAPAGTGRLATVPRNTKTKFTPNAIRLLPLALYDRKTGTGPCSPLPAHPVFASHGGTGSMRAFSHPRTNPILLGSILSSCPSHHSPSITNMSTPNTGFSSCPSPIYPRLA
jgi:hypothetical protein